MREYIKAITEFIFCEDIIKKSDIILIPGATRSPIPEKAAKLYTKGYAPIIAVSGKYSYKRSSFPMERIISSKYNEKKYNTEADFLKNVLEKNGVPNNNILVECESRNTLENAKMLRDKIEEKQLRIKSAIICCQSFHARRTQMTFSFLFPNIKLYICPVTTQNINKKNWFLSVKGIEIVMGEVERCGKYFLKELLELNLKEDM